MRGKTKIFNPLPSAARTTSGSIDLGDMPGMFDEVVGYLSVTAASGTTPTLDIDYQVTPDEGTTWFTHSSFTQATTTTTERVVFTRPAGVRARLNYTIGGTTPSFTFAVYIEGKKDGGNN